jgi:hypothetical protein
MTTQSEAAIQALEAWSRNDQERRRALSITLSEPEKHEDWCDSVTKMLTSLPPKPAPCNCKRTKPVQEPVAWIGLEQSDMPDGDDPMYDHDFFLKGMAWADAILRKKNATPTEEQPPWVGLTDEDWKQLWTEFDSLPIESDFQDHMVSKYGAGYYTDADMYWQFQQQVIKQMVNAKLKEKNNG